MVQAHPGCPRSRAVKQMLSLLMLSSVMSVKKSDQNSSIHQHKSHFTPGCI